MLSTNEKRNVATAMPATVRPVRKGRRTRLRQT
jgi:hypothetical protein